MQTPKKKRSIFRRLTLLWHRRLSFSEFLTPFAKNWGTRIAAIIIAFCCWGVVKSMEKTTVPISVPLKLITTEGYEAYARSTNGLPIQKITLIIECSRRGKNVLRDYDYEGKIDLTGESENTIPSYKINAKENLVYTGPSDNKDL